VLVTQDATLESEDRIEVFIKKFLDLMKPYRKLYQATVDLNTILHYNQPDTINNTTINNTNINNINQLNIIANATLPLSDDEEEEPYSRT